MLIPDSSQSHQSQKGDGVIVGADMTQEWLLPWWWECYRNHNSEKIAILDFGMSLEMKEWCRERGELIRLQIDDEMVKGESEIDEGVSDRWNRSLGKDFWASRIAWFKKPFACLKTPFSRTLWIDLDCEIRGPIQSLFSYADKPPGIAMAKEQCEPKAILYNSGVIAFQAGLQIIADWALFGLKNTGNFRADDEAFSNMIEKRRLTISEIPPPYNWSRTHEDHSKAVILHWHGTRGKVVLRSRIHLAKLSFFSTDL